MLFDERGADALHLARIGDVEHGAGGLAALSQKPVARGVGGRRVHVGDHDQRPRLAQRLGGCIADAAPRSGDHRDLAVEAEFFEIHLALLFINECGFGGKHRAADAAIEPPHLISGLYPSPPQCLIPPDTGLGAGL